MANELINDFLLFRRQKHPRRKREIKTASAELHRLWDALGDADMDFQSAATAQQWRQFLETRTAEMKPARKKLVRRIHRQFFEYLAGVRDLVEPARSAYSFLDRLSREQMTPAAGTTLAAATDPSLLELRQVQMLISEQSEILERTAEEVQVVGDGMRRLVAGAGDATTDRIIYPQDLIPALDELQAALDWRRASVPAVRSGFLLGFLDKWRNGRLRGDQTEWQHGVVLIRDRLLGLLERAGVYPFGEIGEAFDPARHVAVAVRRQPGVQAGTITRVVRCGYRRDNVVLRYAEVEAVAGDN